MQFGIIGLGRMGGSLARLAMQNDHSVAGYNRAQPKTQALAKEGLDPAVSLAELVEKLKPLRLLDSHQRTELQRDPSRVTSRV